MLRKPNDDGPESKARRATTKEKVQRRHITLENIGVLIIGLADAYIDRIWCIMR